MAPKDHQQLALDTGLAEQESVREPLLDQGARDEFRSLKVAMRPLTRLLDFFSADVPEEASIVANAANPTYRRTFLRTMGRNLYGWGIGLVGRALVEKPTLVTDKDWDTLIVLDACRYDAMTEAWAGRGGSPVLPSVISPGTTTLLWIEANFVNNPAKTQMEDVTVIAGNPYMSEAYFDFRGWPYPFRESIDVWKGGWDGTLEAVPPREVFRAAREVQDGRILAHFYQPHSPFIQDPDITWAEIEAGEVSLERAWRAYGDNLRLALAWALRLVGSVEGRVVITADHGELFGEYGLFAHPHKVFVPELVTVPWIELRGGGTPQTLERPTQEEEAYPASVQWGA